MFPVPIGNAANVAVGFGRCLRPGLSAHISTRWRSLRNRCDPYRLQSLRSLRAALATAFGGPGLAGRCSTARPSATRCPLRAGNRVLARSARCGPHHFPALRSGALAVSAPVLGREAADAAWGVRKALPDVDGSLCHVCSLRQPAAPVLRCAPARGVPLGIAPGRPWLGRCAPCARTIAPTRRQAPPTPRVSVARTCPKEPSHRGWAPSVQPIRRST